VSGVVQVNGRPAVILDAVACRILAEPADRCLEQWRRAGVRDESLAEAVRAIRTVAATPVFRRGSGEEFRCGSVTDLAWAIHERAGSGLAESTRVPAW
jgi:hypothetical protein